VAAALCRRDRGRQHRDRRPTGCPLRPTRGLGGIYLSNVVARLPDPLGATIVFEPGRSGTDPPGRGHAQPPNPLLPEGGVARSIIAPARLRSLAGLIRIAPQAVGGACVRRVQTLPSTKARCIRFSAAASQCDR